MSATPPREGREVFPITCRHRGSGVRALLRRAMVFSLPQLGGPSFEDDRVADQFWMNSGT